MLKWVQWRSFVTLPVKYILLSKKHQINVVFDGYKYQLPGYAIFCWFFVSVINRYHINGLHLFWGSFEWFYLQIISDAKYLFLSCRRRGDQGLIVITVYYFQIWLKKEHNIIISSHLGYIYIKTPYITMYMETPYITMYIETP